MSRRRAQSDSSNVSLFPFLAVLLCTMGSLIVILVVLAHQARLEAAQNAQKDSSTQDEQFVQIRDELKWRIEHLAETRQKTAADLQHDQLELSHLEEYLRKLQDRLERLAAAAQALKQSGEQTAEQRAESEAQLRQLRQQVVAATEQLAQAQEKARNRPTSYSVVPYEGPNGTRRRPIFIECRSDSVILQPEGVVLRSRDFEEPLGPGNPLASALRATREYLTSIEQGQDPYPLLLVRPNGIGAYYKAREAIESWGPDFGYELVGGEWKLDFPPADPSLEKILHQAVDQGRMYQERLALAAPSRYGNRRPTYRASPHRGGIIRTDGSGGLSDNKFREDSGEGFGEGSDRNSRRGSGSDSRQNASRGHGEGSGKSGSDSRPTGSHQGSPGGSPGNSQSAGPAGSVGSSTAPPQGSSSRSGTGGSPFQQGSPQSSPQGAKPSDSRDEFIAPQQRMQNDGSQFGNPSSGQKGSRDNNWGLPNAGGGSVAVRRTVRVICRADRLIIMHEDGQRPSKVIALGPRTNDSIDKFVSSLWDHMKGWGIAGNGLHWQPVLRLQVGPQGAGRAADLDRLLHRSGLEVRQEGTP